MATGNVELSDTTHQNNYNSETKLTAAMDGRKNGSGCYVSTAVGIFLILLGVLLAVAVGLIVYFAVDGRDLVCQCETSNAGVIPDSASITEQCHKLAESGNVDLCNRCLTPSERSTVGPPVTILPQTVTDVRLPSSVIPVHYNVRLQPYMYSGEEKDFSFKGYVHIRVKCTEPTNNITLHTKELKLDNSTLRLSSIQPWDSAPSVVTTEEDMARQFFIMKLNRNMEKDKEYAISVNFTAALTGENTKGLYLNYYNQGDTKVYLAATQFEATDARRAFPCFDEPALKATFNITLVRKRELISISNMPIIASETWSEGGINWVADIYDRTPKMSTYLLAFVICDFNYTRGVTSRGTQYRVFTRPEVVTSTNYALDLGVKILPFYEDYFNTPYPLPKQDMIGFSVGVRGAMENWGLITYGEESLLYTPGVSTEINRKHVASVVSHELAHQWFGNIVTMSWWDDIWLNEGFAQFVSYLGIDHAQPEWNVWDEFCIGELQSAFSADGIIDSHPVYVTANNPDEIMSIFDGISYSKGASIIRMMRHFLGPDTFRLGMVRYLQNKKFDSAFHDDLWAALSEQARTEGKSINVKDIMDTWLLQMNYPVVTVTRDRNNQDVIHVSQNRYLADKDAEDPKTYQSQYNYMWTIPLTFTTSNNPNFNQIDTQIHWMYKNESNKNIRIGRQNLPDAANVYGWILCNTQQNGLYRVNYELENWRALINQLETNPTVISTINRAQIINDAWWLAKPGILSLEIALNTLNYLDKEMSHIPWTTAMKELTVVAKMISLTPTYGMFERMMREKATPPFNAYSLVNTGATHSQTIDRVAIAAVACVYGVQQCKDEALRQFRFWLSNKNNNQIDLNLRSTVYCTAIAEGGWDEWKFALDMYVESNIQSEKANLRDALMCSRKKWILLNLLKTTLDENSPLDKDDALHVMTNMAENDEARLLTWQFYGENFGNINRHFNGSSSWIIESVTKRHNTEFQLNDLLAFTEKNKELIGESIQGFEYAADNIRSNIKWMKKNYQTVHSWFMSKYNMN